MRQKTALLLKNLTIDRALRARRDSIVYRLKSRGYTVSSLARQLGVSLPAVTNTLRRPYPRIEKAIAEILGEPVQKLFSERYDPEGRSLRRPGRPRKNQDNTEKKSMQTFGDGDPPAPK